MEKMKQVQFARANDAQWQEVAEQSLRGKPYEQLKTDTIEGIRLEPLYTKEFADTYFRGAADDFVDQVRQGMPAPGWVIAQETHENESASFMRAVNEALNQGNEAIVYDGQNPVQWQEEHLEAFLPLLTAYPIYFYDLQADDPVVTLLDRLEKDKRKNVQGIVTGISLPEGYDVVRRAVTSAIKEHHQGADAVTELAVVLAKAVDDTKAYHDFVSFNNDVAVRFAIDTDFFMEIAKLRAFRVLWQTLGRAYGVDAASIPIVGETSLRSFTTYDSATNMLRAGNETLAAVLGGVDVFTVHPHVMEEEMTRAASRTARNIQLVIREETMLKEVQDPAGGSYFLDTLTSQLTKQAWQLFLEIEAAGGFAVYEASGALEERLKQTMRVRKSQLANGKNTLVGTNRYADPTEERSGVEGTQERYGERLAAMFEDVRAELHTRGPRTVLLRFGTLAACKPMTDMVKELLAVGGITPEESPIFQDMATAKAWLATADYDYHIFCAHPDDFLHFASAFPIDDKLWMDAAGHFTEIEKEKWRLHGFRGFMDHTLDMVQKLTEIWNQHQRRRLS